MTAINSRTFETVLAKATVWITAEEQRVLLLGLPLTRPQQSDAIAVGIKCPERVRLVQEEVIRLPSDPVLSEMARSLGLRDSWTLARTYRYGIAIRRDHWSDREVLVHELVHTRQYEIFGSIEKFLRPYLKELLPPFRYPDGPLEQEARKVAATICGAKSVAI
jgi:hypothetical protein